MNEGKEEEKRREQNKKIRGAVIAAAAVCAAELIWLLFVFTLILPYTGFYNQFSGSDVIAVIIPVAIFIFAPLTAGVLIVAVLIQRIKELRKGLEDDISQY